MPAVRSPYHPSRECWAKRGERRCLLHRGHLGHHENGDLRWFDSAATDVEATDVDTKGRL